MRVAFICLGSPFTPSMLYKENLFVHAAVEAGHEVLVVASDSEYVSGELHRTDSESSTTEHGYLLVRHPPLGILPRSIGDKLRIFPGLLADLKSFAPDLVYFNVPQIHGLLYAKTLREMNPSIRIVVHFSTTYINSGTNWASLKLLHGTLYRRWITASLQYVDSVYYIMPESKRFLVEVYGLPEARLEELPLPGELVPPARRTQLRSEFRHSQGIPEDDLVFLHTGKMKAEKETLSLLRAFSESHNERWRLLIAGSFSDEIEVQARKLIAADPRITYLGFVNGDDLIRALCAADLYLQPGTASQTAQTALCCGTPVVVRKLDIYRDLVTAGGFLLNDADELPAVFESIEAFPEQLESISHEAFGLARSRLDSRALFRRLQGGEVGSAP